MTSRVLLVLLVACSSPKGDSPQPAGPAPASPEPTAVTAGGPAIAPELAAKLAPDVAAELARTWESSGTRARLESAGLTASSPTASRTDLGAAASFAVSGAGGLAADVHFFSARDALDAATARVGTAPFARNGAYLVLVTSADPAAAARIVAAVSGEE